MAAATQYAANAANGVASDKEVTVDIAEAMGDL